jgi:nucleoside-diphosphate-sugar epimerase
LHITNFKWDSVLEVAKIIANFFPGSVIKASKKQDQVQQGKRNEPNKFILKYWKPKTTLENGIKKIIGQMGFK